MRLRIYTSLAALLALVGCTTLTPEQRRALDEEQCRSYGFRSNTDAFAECLQRIDLDRRAARRAQMIRMDQWHDPVIVYRPIVVDRDE